MKTFIVLILMIILAATWLDAGEMIQYKSGEEQVSGYYAKPSGGGPFPALVVIHEWWGLNDQIKGMADRFAAEGYAALAVDLYRGKVTANPDEAHQYSSGLPEDRALGDLQAAFRHLQSQKDVQKNLIGSIGWCMGGGQSLRLAISESQLAACVIYYGRLVNDPQMLKKINAPVLGIFGETDKSIPPEMAKKWAQQMKELGKTVEIHIYPAAGHGFANETGKNYNKEAALDAWNKTREFLAKYLKK